MIKIKKPPLHNKKGAQIEDFIKLADESIAKINQELVPKPQPAPQNLQKANFNLSVNNSFNTSINNDKKPELQFSSGEDIQGRITKDAIILEQKLTKELKNQDPKKSIQAVGHTFDEIIKRDKDFGKLLLKIK